VATGSEEFDAQAVGADITRIREKLRRLDEERRQTAQQLEQALDRAQRRLPPDEPPDG
jgi:hypothetical protein